MKTPQTRWRCPFCKAEGWWTPSTHIGVPPSRDHDRPDGRKCHQCCMPYRSKKRWFEQRLKREKKRMKVKS